jgi:hypothetical protein
MHLAGRTLTHRGDAADLGMAAKAISIVDRTASEIAIELAPLVSIAPRDSAESMHVQIVASGGRGVSATPGLASNGSNP